MIAFLKEQWMWVAVFIFFCVFAAAGPSVLAPEAWYVATCFVVGFFLNRKTAGGQPRRWRTAGRILRVVGPLVGAVLVVWTLWHWVSQITIAFTAFVFIAGLLYYGWGDQLAAEDAYEVMKRDPRPPIVFLRPFKEDERKLHDAPVGEREGGDRGTSHVFTASREQDLAKAVQSIGPFIAIGRPGEPLAALGASRVYLGDKEWKPFVKAMVPFAAAIALQPEFTPGTLWEIGLVVQKVDLRRLLLILPDPSLRPFRYERVRKLVQETFHVALPSVDEAPPCDAMFFDAQKKPTAIRLHPAEAIEPFIRHIGGLGPPGSLS